VFGLPVSDFGDQRFPLLWHIEGVQGALDDERGLGRVIDTCLLSDLLEHQLAVRLNKIRDS
jgi:hypothetical protein